MKKKKTHKDVEFFVWNGNQILRKVFRTFDEATAFAISLSVTRGEDVYIDVVIYSRSGARWYGGDYGVEVYEEDTEASISDRIVVRAESLGRIA